MERAGLMKLTNEIPDAAGTVLFGPDAVHVGQTVHLAIRLSADQARGMTATHVLFRDSDGNESDPSVLAPTADQTDPGTLLSAPVTMTAPEATGASGWMAVLLHPLEDCSEVIDGEIAFDLPVAGHPVAVTVWDVPYAVEAGAQFAISVGLKCTCGCASDGWDFVVCDAAGADLARGRVGTAAAAGTSGLCHTSVTLTAPATPGQQVWQVTALPPVTGIPHAGGTTPVRIDARPAPEVTLRVEAYDAASGEPVARAKLVAHPYRTFTDSDGVALLQLPKGPYRVYVSGKSYFASQTQETIERDMTIRAALYVDREFSDADNWA
jgi:hypothetical protein